LERLHILHESIPNLSIVNLVATADLGQSIDLESLRATGGFRYDPCVYKCAYLKDSETHGKVSIFSTGKMISVATKSFELAEQDLEHAMNTLTSLGIINKTRITAKLQNIVATGDIGHPLDVARFAMRSDVVYEPEQFPAAIYYPEELGGACVLVFASGKVVFSGIKTTEFVDVCESVLRKLSRPE